MKDPLNDLSPEMQARLNKWKENVLPVKNADFFRNQSPGNFVPRQRDYGDDIRDFEKKDEKAWQEHLAANPMYRNYR